MHERSQMSRVSLKGVVVGGITDILATNIAALPVVFYLVSTIDLSATPEDQIVRLITSSLQSSARIFTILTVSGSICSLLGGYVAARIAKRGVVLNGFLSSFLCLALSLYSLLWGTCPIPVWQHVALLPLGPACGAIGGYVMTVQNPPSNVS